MIFPEVQQHEYIPLNPLNPSTLQINTSLFRYSKGGTPVIHRRRLSYQYNPLHLRFSGHFPIAFIRFDFYTSLDVFCHRIGCR
ncbi:hypothetical protein AAG747_22005 [Rapidithrix thailandica]|uniref:Uncharacterized protein n=1 Tax=Rapidithrix thailandica TaxID=413964 RepID=A0AAW9SE36_9BACT